MAKVEIVECEKCGAPIVSVKTSKGKTLVVDAVVTRIVMVDESGEELKVKRMLTGNRLHSESCQQGEEPQSAKSPADVKREIAKKLRVLIAEMREAENTQDEKKTLEVAEKIRELKLEQDKLLKKAKKREGQNPEGNPEQDVCPVCGSTTSCRSWTPPGETKVLVFWDCTKKPPCGRWWKTEGTDYAPKFKASTPKQQEAYEDREASKRGKGGGDVPF